MVYDKESGIPVVISDENIRQKYPLKYYDVVGQCKERYSNFFQNKKFNTIMKQIKINEKLHHERKLDPNNTKTQKQSFYSSNIWKELDKYYKKNVKSTDTKKEVSLFSELKD